jgi:thiamine biosynthesis lipoprotein
MPARIRRAQPLLGTFVEIEVAHVPACDTDAAIEAAFAAVAEVHRLMSFQEVASDVGRLNRDAGLAAVPVDALTYRVLEIALDVGCRSAGAFDITAASMLQSEPRGRQRQDAICLLADNRVQFAEPVTIDLSGIAKGFAVDRAIEALRRHGIDCGLVNAGGDLAGFGPHRHAIDIRDPRRPAEPLCTIELMDAALASSAGIFDPSRSTTPAPSAVIDPTNARPLASIIGATVCAPSCIIADALTKVVMIAGEAAAPLLRHYGASALFVSARGEVHVTSDWKDEVRLAA